MNDNVKKIPLLEKFAAQSLVYVDTGLDDGKELVFSKEKFAELIVKECATTCDNIGKEARKEWKAKYIPHDDGRSDGAWECKAAILEQFGVEE